jgi:hypothetical protein
VLRKTVAVGFVLCATLLVGTGSTATYAGETRACPGPIVRAEGDAAPLPTESSRIELALEAECERLDHRRLVLAGLAALLGLVAGAAAWTPRPGNGSTKVDTLAG